MHLLKGLVIVVALSFMSQKRSNWFRKFWALVRSPSKVSGTLPLRCPSNLTLLVIRHAASLVATKVVSSTCSVSLVAHTLIGLRGTGANPLVGLSGM